MIIARLKVKKRKWHIPMRKNFAEAVIGMKNVIPIRKFPKAASLAKCGDKKSVVFHQCCNK